jgi:hypothetical protein
MLFFICQFQKWLTTNCNPSWLAQCLESLSDQDQEDIWTYVWGSPFFSPTKAYKLLIGTRIVHPRFIWIWKSSTQKTQGFLLAAPRGLFRHKKRSKKKNKVLPSYDCVLCHLQVEETVDHLFLRCPFAQDCWSLLNILIPHADAFAILKSIRSHLNVPFFMDIIIIMSWCIWMAENDHIFEARQPSLQSVAQRFKHEFALVILQAKQPYDLPHFFSFPSLFPNSSCMKLGLF